jgi:dipeptidyl aminopeptidase/acylaminoacyl peptidase
MSLLAWVLPTDALAPWRSNAAGVKILGRLTTIAAAVIVAWACAVSIAGAAPPPASAFFAEPALSQALLSPDGRKIAMRIASPGRNARLAVFDTRTASVSEAASFNDSNILGFEWISDQRLIFDTDVELEGVGTTRVGPGLFAVDADGGRFRSLKKTTASFVTNGSEPQQLDGYAHPVGHPRRATNVDIVVAVPGERSSEKFDYFDLKRVDTLTGRQTDIESPIHAEDWTFDADGRPRTALTRVGGDVHLHLRDPDGRWRQVAKSGFANDHSIEPVAVGPDGAIYVEAQDGDKAAIFTIDPADGRRAVQPVLRSKDYDIRPAVFVTDDRELLGVRFDADAEVTHWFDPALAKLQQKIDQRLPLTANRISVPAHGDSPWVLVEAFADAVPTTAYAYDRRADRLVLLGSSHPGLDRRDLGRTDFVYIPARDGSRIPAYLTLPPGERKTALPMVVLVHGGPWIRGANWAFDPEVQFLASRGYAVLQPAFRGSTGFGSAWNTAGYRQWGRSMQRDLADSARWAIERGIADPKRIAIGGSSYGGYATLMGLIQDPELFRCGFEAAGPTDMRLFLDPAWGDLLGQVRTYEARLLIGDPDTDGPAMDRVSPLKQAAELHQPVLMAYGEWDPRVPLVHGERMRDALKRSGNNQVEWIEFARQGHGWASPATRIDFWTRVETFLARHFGAPR